MSLAEDWRKAANDAVDARFWAPARVAGNAAVRVAVEGLLLELADGDDLTWDQERVFQRYLKALGRPYVLGDVETWQAERDAEAECD